MKKINLLIFVLMLAVSSCTFYKVDTQEIIISPHRQSKQANSQIQYLETITVPYDVVGHVTVNTERRNSMEEVIEKMKHQASLIGGDAFTNIVQIDKPSAIAHVRTVYTATVVIFK